MIDIDALSGRELKIAVAEVLGYTLSNWLPAPPYFISPDGEYYSLRDLPDWPTDITAAWELDGEGMLWRMIETPYGVEVFNQYASAYCLFSDFPTKAAAYAVARCRAWLKAQQAGAAQ